MKNTSQLNLMRKPMFMTLQSSQCLSLCSDKFFAVQNFQGMEKFNKEISKSS